jgi:hypothetical protein
LLVVEVVEVIMVAVAVVPEDFYQEQDQLLFLVLSIV